MNRFSIFLILVILGIWISCADQNSEYTPGPLTIDELMMIETTSWQANAKDFAESNTLVAFVVEAEELRTLSIDGSESVRLSLALNREGEALSYLSIDGESNDEKERAIEIAQHVADVASISLPPALEPVANPENSIAHEVAASWTNQWTKDGQEWLRTNEVHSFEIPAKSIYGVLSARPEQVIFHMALEERATDGLIPHLVLTGKGNLKNESSCFDFTAPCPPVCD